MNSLEVFDPLFKQKKKNLKLLEIEPCPHDCRFDLSLSFI